MICLLPSCYYVLIALTEQLLRTVALDPAEAIVAEIPPHGTAASGTAAPLLLPVPCKNLPALPFPTRGAETFAAGTPDEYRMWPPLRGRRQICCRFTCRVTCFLDPGRKKNNSAVSRVMHGAGSPRVSPSSRFPGQGMRFGLLLLCLGSTKILPEGPKTSQHH